MLRDRSILLSSARFAFPVPFDGDDPPPNPNPGDPPSNPNPPNPNPGDPPAPKPADSKNPPNPLDPPADPPKNDPPASTWPTDWREQLANGDEKLLSVLKRYTSPKSWSDAAFALRQKMSSGELKRAAPGKDAKPEEIAAWRKEMGIPESPDKYDLTLEGGLVIGDEDKPYISKFTERMHGKNASNEVVKEAVSAYYEIVEEQKQQRLDLDNQQKAETEDTLRAEWGNDYRANLTAIHNLLDTAPTGVKDRLFSARFGDGRPLFSDPDTLRFLAQVSREINPVPTLVPGTGGSQLASIDTRMAELTALMGDRESKYWKGPEAAKLQQEFRDLATAQEKLKARQSGA